MSDNNQQSKATNSMQRREFVKQMGAAALAGAASPLLFNARMAHASPLPAAPSESAVGQFYASLSKSQRTSICLPFDHKLRSAVNANWHIREALIGDDFYSDEQRELIDKIVRNVTTPDGYDRLKRQMLDDDGGIESYSVAIFGSPGTGKFQWEMTGRHLTLRADGDRADKVAFGGPLVYGHGEEDTKQNLFHYQTKKANEVFAALSTEQRKAALLDKVPRENSVQVQGSQGTFTGMAVKQLSSDQKELVKATLRSVLGPYRDEDRQEAIEIVRKNGGIDSLHMAFYQEEDLNDDKVWDVWRVEGPALVCHFRGAPHVHAYINVREKA